MKKVNVDKPKNLEIKLAITKSYNQIEQCVLIDRQNDMLKKDIAKKHNVSKSYITNILKKHNVNHLDHKKLTESEVKEIKKLLENMVPYSKIAKGFGITKSTVYEISKGFVWKNI